MRPTIVQTRVQSSFFLLAVQIQQAVRARGVHTRAPSLDQEALHCPGH